MYRRETARLYEISRAATFRLVVSRHAERQMKDRDIARFDVERVLKTGAVVMVETDPDGSERWRVAGHDTDAQRIEVVVEPVPPSLLVLVTAIRVS